MRHERSEIVLLLGLLLLFSSVLGALHAAEKPNQSGQQQIQTQNAPPLVPVKIPQVALELPTLPAAPVPRTIVESSNDITQHIFSVIEPLAATASEEQIVDVLRGISADNAQKIIIKLTQKNVTPRDVLLPVIFGVALHYPLYSDDQRKILSIIFDTPALQSGDPIFYAAAKSSYAAVIPALLALAKTHPASFASERESLRTAIAKNNLVALKRMYKYGVTINQDLANALLWETITAKKRVNIARFLLRIGADKEYTRDGVSVLIAAVQSNRLPMVRALVEAQADITRIVKNEIGNALQVVVDSQQKIVSNPALRAKYPKRLHKMVQIEQFLRKHEARKGGTAFIPKDALKDGVQ